MVADQVWLDEKPTKDCSAKPGSSVFDLLTGRPLSENSTPKGFVNLY